MHAGDLRIGVPDSLDYDGMTPIDGTALGDGCADPGATLWWANFPVNLNVPGFRAWLDRQIAQGAPNLLGAEEHSALAAAADRKGGKGALTTVVATYGEKFALMTDKPVEDVRPRGDGVIVESQRCCLMQA